MRQQTGIAAIVALAGLCASAAAQDSTSKNLGDLPGDALNPWSDHCAAYVVDLSPFMTSKGTQFGIAPLLKTTKVDSFVSPLEDQFFNNLYGSSTISSGTLSNMPYPQGSYMLWEDAPGFGVNPDPTKNDAGMMVSPMGNSSQFAAVISEFGTTSGGQNFNGMVGALVNFDPMNPNRLYVDRRMAAINTADEFAGDESQIGGGSIDAHGNLFIRGDNNGSTGTDQISNNNIFRVRVQDRDCMVPNIISASSTDATDVLMQNFFGNTDNDPKLGVPNHIPQRIAGGHGLSVGTNAFDSSPLMYVADTGSFTSSGSHLDMTGGIGSDHRGSFGTTSHDFLGNGSDYTAAIMAKDATGQTMVLNVVGMDSAGAIQGTMGFQIPSMLTDNDDGYMLSYNSGTEMQNYTGATLFRGGIGHVALGRDQMGRSMLAAVVNENGFSDDWAQQIVVCRYNPATGMEEWALAAYVDEPTALDPDSNDSKAICDADGNIIGRLTDLSDVTNFGLFGPGMSAASIDSVGNIWFLSSVELFDRGPKGEPDFDTALIRAIYNPETFSYKLEMILETGADLCGSQLGHQLPG